MAFLALIPSFLAHKDVLFMQTLRLPVTAKCRDEWQDLLDWRQWGSRRHFKSPSDAVIPARFIMKSQQPETWIWQAPLILVSFKGTGRTCCQKQKSGPHWGALAAAMSFLCNGVGLHAGQAKERRWFHSLTISFAGRLSALSPFSCSYLWWLQPSGFDV